jgi:hypothetical protein
MSDSQKPSVGRIVHYLLPTAAGDVVRPAIITSVEPGGSRLSLAVFASPFDKSNSSDLMGDPTFSAIVRRTDVPQADAEKFVVGTWRWPPRV